MNTIFDYVGAILHTKDRSIFTSVDNEQGFQPFMVNRWISMYSQEMATVVNVTTNKYAALFHDKRELFNFYVSIYPKLRNKRIAYIKKAKATPTKETDDEILRMTASAMEISQREVAMMQQMKS